MEIYWIHKLKDDVPLDTKQGKQYNVCKSGCWMFSLLIRKQTNIFSVRKIGRKRWQLYFTYHTYISNNLLIKISINACDLNREKHRGNK